MKRSLFLSFVFIACITILGAETESNLLPVSFSSDLSDVNLKIYIADNPDHIVEAMLGYSIYLAAGTYRVWASKSGYLDHIQEFKVPASAPIPIPLYPEGIVSRLLTKKGLPAPKEFRERKADPIGSLLSWTDTETHCNYIIDKRESGADLQNGLISFSSGIERWTDTDGKANDLYRIYGVEYDLISKQLFVSLPRIMTSLNRPTDEPRYSFVPYDAPPAMIGKISPVYPDLARQNRVEGTVVVEVLILNDGTIWDVAVKRSVPGLDEAAIDAVRKVRFQPGKAGGQAIDVFTFIPVVFKID